MIQDITRRQPGHHLSQMERGRIAELYATGTSKREIAAKIGVCHQTINNEIDRGTVKQAKRINGKLIYHTEYSPEAAQTRYETARLNCHRPDKFAATSHFLAWYVNQAKTEHWSPDAAVGAARRAKLFTPEEMVCTTALLFRIVSMIIASPPPRRSDHLLIRVQIQAINLWGK